MFVWGYALAWFLLNDRVKLLAYRIFDAANVSSVIKKAIVPTPAMAAPAV